MFQGQQPVSWLSIPWPPVVLDRFQAQLGDPAFQTLWEFLALLIVCEVWAPRLANFTWLVQGDNTGALQSALHIKGRGLMNHIAREFTWRKVV